MSETVAVPLVVGVLLCATWAASSGSIARWAAVGALGGLVALTRGDGLGVAVLIVPAAILTAPRQSWRRRVSQCAAALVAAALVIAPWVVRNASVFHPPVLFSSDADTAIAGANCAAVYHGSQIGLWNFGCTDYQRRNELGEARYSRTIGDQGLRYALNHADRLPVVMSLRMLRSWGLYNPVQQVRSDAVESRNVRWQQMAWFVSMLMLLLAIPGIVSLRHRRFELVVLAAPIFLVTAASALTFGDQRYVLTAVPELAIAVALTIGWGIANATRLSTRLAGRPSDFRPRDDTIL
jgi:hypothetical protein